MDLIKLSRIKFLCYITLVLILMGCGTSAHMSEKLRSASTVIYVRRAGNGFEGWKWTDRPSIECACFAVNESLSRRKERLITTSSATQVIRFLWPDGTMAEFYIQADDDLIDKKGKWHDASPVIDQMTSMISTGKELTAQQVEEISRKFW